MLMTSWRTPHVAVVVFLVFACSGCGDSSNAPDSRVDSDVGRDVGEPVDGDVPDDASSDATRSDTDVVDTGPGGPWLRDRYPADEGIGEDPAALFHDDFETGWGRWSSPRADTATLTMETGEGAHSGRGHLRSTVTLEQLAADMYISSQAHIAFPRNVDTVYTRFHARFPNVAPNPHHWVRMTAGREGWDASGLANTVPAGDDGFWFDLDANDYDRLNFYVYWHLMRSGRCNDGTATPGCAGDQGTTYHYGNVFRPEEQPAIVRDEWFCIEFAASANTPGTSDGWLEFWIDDAPVIRYAPGEPEGTWLRDQFHQGGCEFSACEPPSPFEGFDFRTDESVRFKAFTLDAYYERDSTQRRREAMEERGLVLSDEQTVLYDDVVVAEERIGCRR